ncbi:MAG: choice-of-anchor B family protein [Flavobacteriales bacterium]|nr:choice-of-anchor B family protein [Flavobacteriales bacterium]
MRSILALFLFSALVRPSVAQLNITLLGQYDYQAARNSDLSNIWGYTDELGNEYALIGVNGDDNVPNSGGLSVVDITDPANPVEVFFTPGPNSIWREIKTYGDHAYMTTEAELGLTIVDLGPLPLSNVLPTTVFNGNGWLTAHSLFIDENGLLYLHGTNRGNGGVIFYDLTQDPMAPVEVGEFDQWYIHDSYARGDTMYAGHIYDGFFSMVDVSDPANPVLLGTQTTPNNFTHNTWLDDSGQYLFTTDERDGAFVGAYDVSDPGDIQEVDRLQSEPGSDAIPHNTYWLNDFVVTSYYTYGVAIYDATHPWNMVETGHYDTSPLTGGGFNGAWGVYPFFPSGRLVISDIQEGLFILGPTYVSACWLEGIVTDAQTALPVNSASVEIVGLQVNDTTTFDGLYATGHYQAGTYDVLVQAPGYFPTTAAGIVLQNGQVTVLDVELDPMVPFVLEGVVLESGTLAPVPNAQVMAEGTMLTYTATADANGAFTLPAVFADSYTITAGQWGWRTTCATGQVIDDNTPPLQLLLDSGYYDDFVLDFGWSEATTSSSGDWERALPVGTDYQGDACNPEADATSDCGAHAYVTGNGGGGAGDDDVDDGATVLSSPVFDPTGLILPAVRYERWFFNDGGQGGPNDQLVVSLTNGTDTVAPETVTTSASAWVASQFVIEDYLIPSTSMRLIVSAADNQPGHLVEGGLDLFEVVATGFASVPERNGSGIALWPNPTHGTFTVSIPEGAALVEVVDLQGRVLLPTQRAVSPGLKMETALAAGTYLVLVKADSGKRTRLPLVIR